jgi:hypothetical protein
LVPVVSGWNFLQIFWKNVLILRNFRIKKAKNDNWESVHKKLDGKNYEN